MHAFRSRAVLRLPMPKIMMILIKIEIWTKMMMKVIRVLGIVVALMVKELVIMMMNLVGLCIQLLITIVGLYREFFY